jgi:hypothetical protein
MDRGMPGFEERLAVVATLHVDGGQDAALSSGPPLPSGS